MGQSVVLEINGPLATVELSHAAKFNAMSRAMWRQLRAVFLQIQQDQSLRCVVIRGKGHFCAGGNISEYADFRFQEHSLRAFPWHRARRRW